MIDHISIEVRSLAPSRAFYDAVLAPLGYHCLWATGEAAGYGTSGNDEPFAIKATGETVVLGSNAHIAITAKNRANVGVGLHAEYGLGYFAAFVRDPDGNRIEAVVHERSLSDDRAGRYAAPFRQNGRPISARVGGGCGRDVDGERRPREFDALRA
jgi:catechol 2,3-dioxygenase-like lactoylglutathione lyase family enzyme